VGIGWSRQALYCSSAGQQERGQTLVRPVRSGPDRRSPTRVPFGRYPSGRPDLRRSAVIEIGRVDMFWLGRLPKRTESAGDRGAIPVVSGGRPVLLSKSPAARLACPT
jgi:hypothetical protein